MYNNRENPSTFIFGKNHIFICFPGRTFLSASPHMDALPMNLSGRTLSPPAGVGVTCHHTSRPRSVSSPAQLGAAGMGRNDWFRHAAPPVPAACPPWPPPCPLASPVTAAAATSHQHHPPSRCLPMGNQRQAHCRYRSLQQP